MNNKLVARMIERRADAKPSVRWESPGIAVLSHSGEVVPHYEYMCNVLDILSTTDLEDALKQINELEVGNQAKGSVGLNDRAALMTPESVTFWFEYGLTDGVEIEGGKVSLPQFKLAVQTFLQFLNAPARERIEVEFPGS